MSGIGYEHNKFETCEGCPDRCADPNCHDSCRGYLYRMEQLEKIKAERNKETEYRMFKVKNVMDTNRKAKRYREW